MRKVVLYHLLSLDGVAEEPGDWMFDADEAIFENIAEVVGRQTDVLLGHGTYDYWAGHWPHSDLEPFASFINGTTKHVFSSAELSGGWAHTVRADAPLEEYVRRLKEQPGDDIGVHGSITIAQALLAAGLADELRFVVVPTLAGKGRKLFEREDELRRLELIDSRSTPSGCLLVGYRVAK